MASKWHFLVLAVALIELSNRMSPINFVLNPIYSMKLGVVTIQLIAMPFNFLKNCRDKQPTPHQSPLFARIDEGLPNMFGSCIAVVPSISSRRA
jgi:hypothetical protein